MMGMELLWINGIDLYGQYSSLCLGNYITTTYLKLNVNIYKNAEGG